MAYLPVVTVEAEGFHYAPGRGDGAPIRFYPDRRVEDDIAAKLGARRQRLSRKEFRLVKRAAKKNRAEGLV